MVLIINIAVGCQREVLCNSIFQEWGVIPRSLSPCANGSVVSHLTAWEECLFFGKHDRRFSDNDVVWFAAGYELDKTIFMAIRVGHVVDVLVLRKRTNNLRKDKHRLSQKTGGRTSCEYKLFHRFDELTGGGVFSVVCWLIPRDLPPSCQLFL